MSKQYILELKDKHFILNTKFNSKLPNFNNELKILPETKSNHEGLPYFIIDGLLEWAKESSLPKSCVLLKKYLTINNKLDTFTSNPIYYSSYNTNQSRAKQLTSAALQKIPKTLSPYFKVEFIDKKNHNGAMSYQSKHFAINRIYKTQLTYEEVLGDQNVMGVSNANSVIRIIKNLKDIEDNEYAECVKELNAFVPSLFVYQKTIDKEAQNLQLKYEINPQKALLLLQDLLYIMHQPIEKAKQELINNGIEQSVWNKITLQEYKGFFANNSAMHEAKSYVYMAKNASGEVGFIGLKNSKNTKNSEYVQKYSLTIVQNIANAVCFSTSDLNLCGLGELRNKNYWPIVTPIECQQKLSIQGKVFEDPKMQLLASSIEKNKIENLLSQIDSVPEPSYIVKSKNKI